MSLVDDCAERSKNVSSFSCGYGGMCWVGVRQPGMWLSNKTLAENPALFKSFILRARL